jgi:chorismate synthase
MANPQTRTKTNNSGGIQGGISNGEHIYFRVAFKAPATIGKSQTTATYDGEENGVLEAKGRHDPCVVPRAVPIVEAMAALVVADLLMAQYSRQMARTLLPSLKEALPAKFGGEELVLNGETAEKSVINGAK